MDTAALMRPFVVTVSSDTTIGEVEELLLETGFAAVPVVDGRRGLIGVVGLDDLPLPASYLPVPVPRHAQGGPRTVEEVMTTAVTSVTPATTVADLVRLLRVTRLSSVPVVDGDELVGIVARRDVAEALAGVPGDRRRRLLSGQGEDVARVSVA